MRPMAAFRRLGAGSHAELEEERRLLYVRHDQSPKRSGADYSATAQRPPAGRRRRSARLRQPDAFHSFKHPGRVRGEVMGASASCNLDGHGHDTANRSRCADDGDVAIVPLGGPSQTLAMVTFTLSNRRFEEACDLSTPSFEMLLSSTTKYPESLIVVIEVDG